MEITVRDKLLIITTDGLSNVDVYRGTILVTCLGIFLDARNSFLDKGLEILM